MTTLISVTVGCSQQQPAPSVGQAAQRLGIARFDVQRQPNDGVQIVGVGRDGERIAEVSLAYYKFDEYPGATEAQNVTGQLRALKMNVLGDKFNHESDVSVPVMLPLFDQRLQAVMLDPVVTGVLNPLGVAFVARTRATPVEVAYDGNCGGNWPIPGTNGDQSYHPNNGPPAGGGYNTTCYEASNEYCGYCGGGCWYYDEQNFYSLHSNDGTYDLSGDRICNGTTGGNCTPCGPTGMRGCAPCIGPSAAYH
jgi:hypothetical protein